MTSTSRFQRVLMFCSCALIILLAVMASGETAVALDVQRAQLDNGLTVLAMERPKLPVVSAQVLIKAGSVFDPPMRAGLSNFVASMLRQGTTTRSATQISEEIDFVGGSLDISSDRDIVRASIKVLKDDFPMALDLLADLLKNPAFVPEELEKKRREIRSNLQASEDDPRHVSKCAFDELVFGPHPYHHPIEGYETTLEAIHRGNLVRFHETYYRPNNAILAVVGDIDLDGIVPIIQRHFGAWERQWLDYPHIPDVPNITGVQAKEIDREITQASIYLGHRGIDRRNPDYYAILVMNRILGEGSLGSRLGESIRHHQGLVYHVHSRFNPGWLTSSFEIFMQTKNESANQAIESALAEVRRMRESPVTDQELEDAKTYFTSLFPVEQETNDQVARLILDSELYGLGMDYFERYPRLIRQVTKEDVLRVAKIYLDPENYCLAVVGNAEEMQLEEF